MSEKNNKNNPKNQAGKVDYKIEFGLRKYITGASTWFVCALILIPCYISTKILSMALLIPIVLIMALGFWLEGRKSLVKIETDGLVVKNNESFKYTETRVGNEEIKGLTVKSFMENNEKIIILLMLETGSKIIKLPDIDDKDTFIKSFQRAYPGARVNHIEKMSAKEEKETRKLQYLLLSMAAAGFILEDIRNATWSMPEVLINGLKGGIIGTAIGFVLWFAIGNFSKKNKE